MLAAIGQLAEKTGGESGKGKMSAEQGGGLTCRNVLYVWKGCVGAEGRREGGRECERAQGRCEGEGREKERSVHRSARTYTWLIGRSRRTWHCLYFVFLCLIFCYCFLLIPSLMEVSKLTHSSQAARGRTQGVLTQNEQEGDGLYSVLEIFKT